MREMAEPAQKLEASSADSAFAMTRISAPAGQDDGDVSQQRPEPGGQRLRI